MQAFESKNQPTYWYWRQDLNYKGNPQVFHIVVFNSKSRKIKSEVKKAKSKKVADKKTLQKIQQELIESHLSENPRYDLYDYFPLQKVSEIVKPIKNSLLFAINGSFYVDFGYSRDALGKYVSKLILGDPIGTLKVKNQVYGYPLWRRPFIAIMKDSSYLFGNCGKNFLKTLYRAQYLFFAGPTLFKEDKRIVSNRVWKEENFSEKIAPLSLTRDLKKYSCARTAILELHNERPETQLISFVILEGGNKSRSVGLNLADFSALTSNILRKNSLKIINGLYLDGGACSVLVGKGGECVNVPSGMSNASSTGEKYGEERRVSYAICLVKN